ncbi:MAG: hypothetical protein R3E97_22495 [Candidatus Eisenbacteria bacterium]
MLRRERTRSESQVGKLARTSPVLFVAFDILFDGGARVMGETLLQRRDRLGPIVAELAHPRALFSEGLVGPGRKLFDDAVSRELEGIVAKRTNSRYHSGRRSDDWIKIKRSQTILCVILGFLRDETGGLKSLIVAAEEDGKLVCVGRVGVGSPKNSAGHSFRCSRVASAMHRSYRRSWTVSGSSPASSAACPTWRRPARGCCALPCFADS